MTDLIFCPQCHYEIDYQTGHRVPESMDRYQSYWDNPPACLDCRTAPDVLKRKDDRTSKSSRA